MERSESARPASYDGPSLRLRIRGWSFRRDPGWCREDWPKSSRKESGLQELAAGMHGQIPCQEQPVADDTENPWSADPRMWRGRTWGERQLRWDQPRGAWIRG